MNSAASSNTNPSGVQGVCPTGWHLPSDAEWTELTDYLGGTFVAGGKLNEIGFAALPGGVRYSDGKFGDIGGLGNWWGATEFNIDYAWDRLMTPGYNFVGIDAELKEDGRSVRCVMD
jgi:uncharacterized protein (TIGR02145 family)